MSKLISWTPAKLRLFQRHYTKAQKAKASQFFFKGDEYVTGYAKYLIEYLKPKLK